MSESRGRGQPSKAGSVRCRADGASTRTSQCYSRGYGFVSRYPALSIGNMRIFYWCNITFFYVVHNTVKVCSFKPNILNNIAAGREIYMSKKNCMERRPETGQRAPAPSRGRLSRSGTSAGGPRRRAPPPCACRLQTAAHVCYRHWRRSGVLSL